MGLSALQVEPMVVEEEEPPIEASWEYSELRVEEVDDAPLYPSPPDSDTSTSSATFSGPPAIITSSQPEVFKLNYIDSLYITMWHQKKFFNPI